MVNRGKSVAMKKPHVLKILFFVMLFFLTAALIFVDIGWSEYSILQSRSIDEYAFHRSLLNIHDGFTNLDIRQVFSFGFYSYGFSWFLLNYLFSFPFLGEAGDAYAIVIPRFLTSLFMVLSLLVVTKTINGLKEKYDIGVIFAIFFILSMPGIWMNAVWFHPDYAMSFFILISLYFISKAGIHFNKYYWIGILMLGIAIAIKIQAVTFGAVVLFFYVKNYFEKPPIGLLVTNGLKTVFVILMIFVLNNPYILHPTGFNAWYSSLQQNMLSNATNHGSGTVSYFYRLDEAVFKNFFPPITYFLVFALSIYYMFDNFSKKENMVLGYVGIYIASNFIYLLLFVNKGWGHYYIPLVLLSPILFVAFVNQIIVKFKIRKKFKSLPYLIIMIPSLYVFTSTNIEFFNLRINNSIISYDSKKIKHSIEELGKAEAIEEIFQHESLKGKIILSSPYVNFPLKKLSVDYHNFYTIYGPLSSTLANSSLRNGADVDLVLIRKDDVYFDESLISKMYEIDAYKTSKKIIDEWLDNGVGYVLKNENKDYYLFQKSI